MLMSLAICCKLLQLFFAGFQLNRRSMRVSSCFLMSVELLVDRRVLRLQRAELELKHLGGLLERQIGLALAGAGQFRLDLLSVGVDLALVLLRSGDCARTAAGEFRASRALLNRGQLLLAIPS